MPFDDACHKLPRVAAVTWKGFGRFYKRSSFHTSLAKTKLPGASARNASWEFDFDALVAQVELLLSKSIMDCPPILQTHVGDPDRLSNRGVFPGGPKVFEILLRIDVLCPKGT